MSDNILKALTSAGEDFNVEEHASKILQSCNFVDVSKYVEELTLAEQDLDKNLGEFNWKLCLYHFVEVSFEYFIL